MPLLRTFQFEVKLRRSAQVESGRPGTSGTPPRVADSGQRLGDGGFQECSGLDVEMDVQEYLEGGRNDGVIKRVGRARFPNIVLKRGMFYGDEGQVNRELWTWLQDVVSGVRPVARYDGIIEVAGESPEIAARWIFFRGLPAKISGPQLNARTGDIAIEELQIAHEGLRLEF
ncbi:MAG: phage tail protein [Pirellulaceae bacterium]|nr:phage tail protein [Pirellulaceae bacterium]